MIALPAVAASIAVLTFGSAGRSTWIIHLLSICLSLVLALAGAQLSRRTNARFPVGPIIVFTLLGIAVPLLAGRPGPDRWVSLGPLNIYMAPALIPSFLVACSVWIVRGGRSQHFAFTAIAGASVLLAAQPDASQALALLAASAVAVARSPSRSPAFIIALAFTAVATAWAFSQPDPLQPIPHVEGVFALALGHSLFAGALVIASAVALVAGLYVNSSGGRTWPSVVAVYYAVLFACSVAGLTPAPLIGYGAGPLLGFGLMVATASVLDAKVLPDVSSKPTPLRGAF